MIVGNETGLECSIGRTVAFMKGSGGITRRMVMGDKKAMPVMYTMGAGAMVVDLALASIDQQTPRL
jgi:hypothetical protein